MKICVCAAALLLYTSLSLISIAGIPEMKNKQNAFLLFTLLFTIYEDNMAPPKPKSKSRGQMLVHLARENLPKIEAGRSFFNFILKN